MIRKPLKMDSGVAKGTKRKYPDHREWTKRHAAVMSKMPKDLEPQDVQHGEKTYTVVVKMSDQVVHVEVHVVARGFRVNYPKLAGPQYHRWGEDSPELAWDKFKDKIEKALQAKGPG